MVVGTDLKAINYLPSLPPFSSTKLQSFDSRNSTGKKREGKTGCYHTGEDGGNKSLLSSAGFATNIFSISVQNENLKFPSYIFLKTKLALNPSPLGGP